MSDLSPEAIVAADAAANAVEELHSREAVTETAVEAELSADVAAMQAADAAEEARQAAETAAIAVEIAAEAGTTAESVREQNEEIANSGDRALSAIETLRTEMAPILDRYAQEEAARIAEAQQSTVEEIDVTDGKRTTGSNSGNSDTGRTGDNSGEPEHSGPVGTARRTGKLRRGRRS
jgi:hypothetical protein